MQDVLFLLTGLAIFVSCLGLFGLSAFVVTKRQKEVGIRKVLGSSVSGVIILISRDFLKLVGIGFLVAVPAAYWLANNWLQDFAYRISIGADVFLLSGIIALSLAILAVIWQSIRAALVNPVESLKCE
jgi:putative ABC transport system permease protein